MKMILQLLFCFVSVVRVQLLPVRAGGKGDKR